MVARRGKSFAPGDGRDVERRAVTPRRIAALVALVALAGGGLLAIRANRSREGVPSSAGPPRAAVPRNARAPEGVRIRVEVLNTTKTHGLARRATQLLRDRGFDVVDVGTISPTIDTTIVLDLSGHPAWADAAAKVMAPA